MQKHLDEREMSLSVIQVLCLPDIKQLDSCKHLDNTLHFLNFFIHVTKTSSPAWQERRGQLISDIWHSLK